MTEVERIGDQMRKAFEGEAWHGPAVLETLQGVTPEMAARRPVASAHSIWELVLHMNTWKDVVRRRLGGEPIKDVPPEMDFPPVGDIGAAAWQAALGRLSRTHAGLLEATLAIRDDELETPPPNGVTKRYTLLHGIVQHDLYHAGQIAILKKG